MTKNIFSIFMLLTILIQGCATNKNHLSNEDAKAILDKRLHGAQVTQEKMENGATFTTVRFAGSLKPNANLDCISTAKVTNQINPPALAHAAKKCIEQDEYKKAWALLSMGSGFAYYDLKRLADRSTYGAWKVLKMNTFAVLTKEQRDKLLEANKEILASPEQINSHCDDLKRIGPPAYEPKWAILHGIGVYKTPRNGDYLVNIKPEDVWNELLEKRCSTSN